MLIRVALIGLGPIGAAVGRQLASRPGFTIGGGIDIDPAKAGKRVGDIIGGDRAGRAIIFGDIREGLERIKPDVAVLCTSSSLKKVLPQIEAIVDRRVPIVSTTEELSYPVGANRRLAKRIDEAARKRKVAVLGTGVNPGFVMDALAITLTGVCERVESIRVDRIQDARIRRLPFQQKIGAGLHALEFQQRVDAGTVRHVGLTESVTMIADAMGWKLDRVTDEISPKVTDRGVASEFLKVDAGRVCGLIQDGIGYVADRPVIHLHMEAYLGAPESFDAVTVEGSPRLSMKIPGGVHGDVATASIVVNSIPKVLAAPAGLRTMRDLPIPSFYGGK